MFNKFNSPTSLLPSRIVTDGPFQVMFLQTTDMFNFSLLSFYLCAGVSSLFYIKYYFIYI